MRLSTTGIASLTNFQRDILIFEALSRDQMQSFIPFKDGSIPLLTNASFLASLYANQYPDFTEYS